MLHGLLIRYMLGWEGQGQDSLSPSPLTSSTHTHKRFHSLSLSPLSVTCQFLLFCAHLPLFLINPLHHPAWDSFEVWLEDGVGWGNTQDRRVSGGCIRFLKSSFSSATQTAHSPSQELHFATGMEHLFRWKPILLPGLAAQFT